MAIPHRTDQRQTGGPSWGRRPMVLTQLPRVGTAVQFQQAAPSAAVPAPPLPAAQPEADSPSLRIDLPDLAPPSEPNAKKSRRSSTREALSTPFPQKESAHEVAAAPLLQLHALLAPYAGLIVTLALITSAGLLYWLLLGPAQVSLDYQEGRGQGFGRTSINASVEESPETVLPTFSVPAPEPLSEELPTDELGFPRTRQSGPLDFTKMGDVLPKSPAPERLPVIATRPVSQDATSTKKR